MQTIKLPFKQILTFSFFAAMISAQSPAVLAETSEAIDHKSHHAQKPHEWPGIYNGLTPCPDCIGVKTSLALNANNTYILITQLLGKSPRDFTEKGKYTFDEGSSKITLTSRDGSATHRYLIGDNTITELDSQGNVHTGSNAEKYVLRRVDITSQPPKHSH